MDVGRLCGVQGTEQNATHQRIAGYVKSLVAGYRGMGFAPREEWIAEQTIKALRHMLADTSCTDAERTAVLQFLDLASEEQPGLP
jgi:hypothetical protein